MVSSDEAPTSEPGAEVLVAKEEETIVEESMTVEVEKTPVTEEGQLEQTFLVNGDSSSGRDASSSEDPEKALARADDLFEKGSKSIEEGDLVDAVDCLSRALEIRVAHYGELALECAISYYKYGCALLYKAQDEADPLAGVPKNSPRNNEKDISVTNVEDSSSSMASKSEAKQNSASSNNEEVEEEGSSDKDQEDGNEGSEGDGEDLADADEDDSDLDLAWKMLDVARAIVEKCPEDTLEKVNILAALGEVSMEREDIETSLSDYLKALSILERLVEPDNRRIVELNFRICLVLEVGSKIEEAIPYCQKAISMCKSRLQRLRDNVANLAGLANPISDSKKSGNQPIDGTSDPSTVEEEIEEVSGILNELEKKLEDLQQVMSNPKSIFAELMKMIPSKSTSAERNPSIAEVRSSLNSSQIGAISCGFDSPTVSTAATNGGVTHLGVVGRGIKRASVKPSNTEPSPKKSSLDSAVEKADSCISEVLDSTAQGPGTPTN